MTNNPWETIRLSDYENHMKLHTVRQLQTLNEMIREQLSAWPVQSVMILGIAGGNGLEHVSREKYRAVYGVDVNGEYLEELIANLLVEYIGYDCFRRIVARVKPKVVSCGIQVDTGEAFVSDSPYLRVFDGLGDIHSQIDAEELGRTVRAVGYDHLGTREYPLPNGKKLLQIDFERIEES